MTAMERVCSFIKEAQTYYLATVDGDQPRVRPFGTINIFEGRLYIQTGRVKDVAKQLAANPKAEICAFKDGVWLRVAGELVDDDRVEPKKAMLEAYPELRYPVDKEFVQKEGQGLQDDPAGDRPEEPGRKARVRPYRRERPRPQQALCR